MESSRGRIIHFLQRSKGATAGELAGWLGLAPATVRRHLDVLLRESRVSYQEVRRKTGRPHYLYLLTDRGRERLPQSSHLLARWLFQEVSAMGQDDLKELSGRQVLELALARSAGKMVAGYAHRFISLPLGERVAELSLVLNDIGFMTEWKEEEGGYRLLTYHCPYQLVASAERQVCSLDQHFIGGLIGAQAVRAQCLLDGASCCLYHIREAERAETSHAQQPDHQA